MRKAIGVYGGTFDPIHLGHLMVAEVTRDSFNFEKIIFMPAKIPPHKLDRDIISESKRYEMVEMAIFDNPHFEVSDMEMKRRGPSYSIDTIEELSRIYGPSYPLWMIIGSDALMQLESWMNADKLMKSCGFIVYLRPGQDYDEVRLTSDRLIKTKSAKIELLEGPMMDISSTDIRERIKRGATIKYLVADSIGDYIKENGLYI